MNTKHYKPSDYCFFIMECIGFRFRTASGAHLDKWEAFYYGYSFSEIIMGKAPISTYQVFSNEE